jgi:hypothetical protein
MALSGLLEELDTAISRAEELKLTAEASAAAASTAQKAYEDACGPVLELQAKLRERLGPVLGSNGRTRGA